MRDIVIISTPYIAPSAPAAGPAILKGYLNSLGFDTLGLDYNVKIKNKINDDSVYGELVMYWITKATLTPEAQEVYNKLLTDYAKEFAEYDTRWIGFSVFSSHSQKFLTDFLPYFQRANSKKIKVVIGGHGLDAVYVDSVEPYIDAYILGEGEIALRELLRNNFDYPGINSAGIQIDNLDQLGVADYSDYDLTEGYENWYDGPMIQVTGSRGCVRDCSFCDVAHIWKKFRYRTGRSISNEIISNHEKTGVKHFYFTDSLINGNVKELMNMMRILTDYKQRTGSEITWGGQWIVRSQKGLPRDYYQLIKSSGGFNLVTGVETGSDAVREHMGKNFTNVELDAEMEQFSRHGIVCGFYIIVGYPTETEEDFKETLRMFKRYTKYVADGTISGVAVGHGYSYQENAITPLQKMNIITFLENDTDKWVSRVSNANYLENIRRSLIAQQVLNNLKWPSLDLEYKLKPLIKNPDIWFNKTNQQYATDLLEIKNLDIDLEFYPPPTTGSIDLIVTLVGNAGDTDPTVDIQINQKHYRKLTVTGEQTFIFKVDDCRRRNMLKITLTNKNANDTKLEDGKIIKDKNILINQVIIDNIRIIQPKLQLDGCVRLESRQKEKSNGLYFNNSTYRFYFENPATDYFITKRKFYYKEKVDSMKDVLFKITKLFDNFVKSTGEL